MTLQQLRYVLEVQKEGTITGAADSLFIAQPNLSKAIKDLEQEIGIKIFMRTPKGVTPTWQGSEFLSYAKDIVGRLEELEAIYKEAKEEQNRFRVAMPRASYLSQAIINFVNSVVEDKYEMHVEETSTIEVINRVEARKANLGIIRFAKEQQSFYESLCQQKHFHAEILMDFRSNLVIAKDHELANKDDISEEDFQDCVELRQGDFVHSDKEEHQIDHTCIYVYDRATQYDLLNQIPNAFMFASYIPQEILVRNGLVSRQIESRSHWYTDMLIYPQDKTLRPIEKQFIEQLNSYIGKM